MQGLCLVAQSCLTLWNPMDCNLLDSSVHGVLQAIPIISTTKYFLSVYLSKYYSNAKVNNQWAATTNQPPLSKKRFFFFICSEFCHALK